jgi:hypothetical protein
MTSQAEPFDPLGLRAEFRDEKFWTQNTPRFLSYADNLISKRRWRGSFGASPAGGEEPHDYVLRTVELILEGRRRCPLDLEPVTFVFGVIRSLVAHDADNLENRQLHSQVGTDDSENSAVIDEGELVDRRSPAADELLTAIDLARDFVNALPEQYRAYVELLISGAYSSAAEYAEQLAVTVADIRLMDKAIRRRRGLWKGSLPPPEK